MIARLSSLRLDCTMATKRTGKTSARIVAKGHAKVLPDLPASSSQAKTKLKQRGLDILSDRERTELSRDLEKLARQRREAEADSANLRFSG